MSKRTAGGAKTLPGKYYASEEIYQLENEHIFLKNWLYAGRVSRLKKPCSYFLNEIDSIRMKLIDAFSFAVLDSQVIGEC